MLYILDYGAGNVRSLANSIKKLGFEFKWIECVEDFSKATQLIFPGVGSFGQALESLSSKGYLEPLRDYIQSGKPYFGICIGMQALFSFSEESPEVAGIGFFKGTVKKFREEDGRKIPHIGWNGVIVLGEDEQNRFGIKDNSKFYFVHSYRVEFDPSFESGLSLTKYGNQTFISSVQHSNVFATQFHPEKSGRDGLRVLHSWLEESTLSTPSPSPPTRRLRSQDEIRLSDPNHGWLTKRIVACLDVRSNDSGDLVVTKGDQYDVREKSGESNVRNLGKPVELAQRYYYEGADEITFLNITSFRNSPMKDQPMLEVLRKSAESIFVPLTIGGGIKDTTEPDGKVIEALEVASLYFRAGADKVSIGGDAVEQAEKVLEGSISPSETSIFKISQHFGKQAVVISVDPKRVYANSREEVEAIHLPSVVDLSGPLSVFSSYTPPPDLGPNGEKFCWYQCTIHGGRTLRPLDVVQLAQTCELLGAGELLLNSIDKDGTKSGFDLRLIDLVRSKVGIPVIASSGAGSVAHFEELFERTDVEAGLAAGMFHRREVELRDVKRALKQKGMEIRLDE